MALSLLPKKLDEKEILTQPVNQLTGTKLQRKIQREKQKKLLESQMKQAENLEKKNKKLLEQQKKEAAPKSAQDRIYYRNMYEDGICEVESNLYSKSVEFTDINYQTARRDEQVDIFSSYCEFLNYFDPSINVQITITNRLIDKDDFKEKMLMPIGRGTDNLDKFRLENNNIISQKALEGQNSIIRNKYLTFATKSESYYDAVQDLARIEGDVLNNFKDLDCDVMVQSGTDRVKYLHRVFNPDDKFTFDYDYLVGSSLTTKDYVAPDSIEFPNSRNYEFGDYFGQTLYLKELPPDLTDKLVKDITDISCNLTVTIHINGVEQDEAIDQVKKKIAFMDQQKVQELKKARKGGYGEEMLPEELIYSLKEARELLHDLRENNQRMFKVTFLVNTTAKTKKLLGNNIDQIKSAARKNNCKFGELRHTQKEAMNSSLPLGKNHIDIKRTLTTASTAIFIPFTTQELFQEGGVYYGVNSMSRNLIFHDRTTLQNGNGFILGKPGSGKSFKAKEEMQQKYLNTNDDILIIDPEREYTELAMQFGGQIIEISGSSKTHINPMDMSMNYSDDQDPLVLKSDFIVSLCEIIAGGRFGLTQGQRTIIDRTVLIVYNKYLNNPEKYNPPTLKDFYQVLVAQEEEEARGVALALEMYINGTLSVFSNPTNVDINKRLVVFDTKSLGKQLKTMGIMIVLDLIWNRITQNRIMGKRTWIYIDEIYLLFQNEYSANYLYELYKRARKWGGFPTGITQNIEELLVSLTARTMLSNSEFLIVLSQEYNDRIEIAKIKNMSAKQQKYITNAKAGSGLLFAGKSVIPFEDDFPKETELYKLMTTKLDEIPVNKAV